MSRRPRRASLPLFRLVLVPLALAALWLPAAGCGNDGAYRARIVRTTYGVAHVYAEDLPGLGFGEGYAQAQDHLCSVADQVVRARGERARWFGPGEDDEHMHSDIAMKALRIWERAGDDLARQPEDFRAWYEGYVAGYNEYLADTGVDAVPGWCRGEEWIRPITAQDLAAYHRVVTVTSVNFASMIATAQPPAAEPAGEATSAAMTAQPDRLDRPDELGALDVLEQAGMASNGWALGRDLAASGKGMLLANPHYPWVGSNRFWEKHLVIPGEIDVYGVGLLGIPGVAIGFNDAVAWTHTVSAGERFTLYALDLVPGSPTRYRYDGAEREMTSRQVEVEVLGDGDVVEKVQRTVWFSHYGPILDFPNVGWSPQRVLALRDANEDNDEGRLQWMAMNRAQSLAELQAAHAEHTGIPWVNTIATSAEGIAWYADTSSTPNLSDAALARWRELSESDPMVKALADRGMVLLPGSDSAFEWVDDPAARDPGVVAYAKMPQIERTDYVFNANDSYWLPNSQALLTGYSPLHGAEATQRSLRTRNNDLTLSNRSSDQPAGPDGKFSLDELGDAILSNRSLAAELLKPELLGRCARTPRVAVDGAQVDLSRACEVLASWNDRFDLDSRGAVLFRELMGQYAPADFENGRLFAVPFDPADPIGTPRGLAPSGPEGDLALQNLARAVKLLERRDIAIDAPLGELQYVDKASRRIAVHGGHGSYEGVMNMQQNGENGTTLEPMDEPPVVEGSRFLTEKGYPVVHGSSFQMVLEYTDQGPNAKAFLTYGQSGDPASPHFTDQTELYAKKEWRKILFDEAEIEANKISETVLKSEERRAEG